MNTSMLNVRINKDIKSEAQKVASTMGLDLSSAVKLFLNKMVMTKSIPFDVNTNGRMNDPKFIRSLKKDVELTIKHGKRYSSAKEMLDDILG